MISVDNLVKEYKIPVRKEGKLAGLRSLFSRDCTTIRAVDNINFSLEEGEIVGYIGKNGAGKSTTIKMLSGILHPTSGSISINGLDPSKERMQNTRQIGVVFGQKTQLWWDVPLIESYRLLKEIYKIDNNTYKKNLAQFVTMLRLEEILNQPVRQMSLGQRVKADIAAALLHDPKVLFLDEPTIGVDVLSKKALYDFILEINKKRKITILLTTHDLGDMEKLCSRIMIIDHGKLMYDGTLNDMTQQYGSSRSLAVEFDEDVVDFMIPGARLISNEDNRKTFSFNRTETTPAQLIDYISKKYAIKDLRVIEPAIDEVLKNLYDDEERY